MILVCDIIMCWFFNVFLDESYILYIHNIYYIPCWFYTQENKCFWERLERCVFRLEGYNWVALLDTSLCHSWQVLSYDILSTLFFLSMVFIQRNLSRNLTKFSDHTISLFSLYDIQIPKFLTLKFPDSWLSVSDLPDIFGLYIFLASFLIQKL